jgi:hypothetical protein
MKGSQKKLFYISSAVIALPIAWLLLFIFPKNAQEVSSEIRGAIVPSEIVGNSQISKIYVFQVSRNRTQTFIKMEFSVSVFPDASKFTFIDQPLDIALKGLYNIDKDSIFDSGLSFSDECHLLVDSKGETWIFDHDWKSVIVAIGRK